MDSPENEYVPGRQVKHVPIDVAADAVEYVPNGHSEQPPRATDDDHDPGRQGKQAAMPAEIEYDPAPHGRHSVTFAPPLSALTKVPDGHGTHPVEPADDQVFSPQLRHELDLLLYA